jgi:serine/threonine protein kinase
MRMENPWFAACKVFSPYSTFSVLTQGTFGVVHAAIEKRSGKVCAVKGMRKSPRKRHALTRLAREATILELLDGCPQVPRLLAKYETARFAYLVMEKAEGECLSSFVRVRAAGSLKPRLMSTWHSQYSIPDCILVVLHVA